MQKPKISVWGTSPEETNLVRAMLKLTEGLTTHAWSLAEPAVADVILLGSQNDRPPERDAGMPWPVLVQIRNANELDLGDGSLSIVRPIRVMGFITLLNESGQRLDSLRSGQANPAAMHTTGTATSKASPLLNAAQALKDFRENPDTGVPVALLRVDHEPVAMMNLARGTVSAALPMVDLIVEIADGFGRVVPVASLNAQQIDKLNLPAQSLDALCWRVGAYCSQQSGLAPWLEHDTSYKLRSWPDFGAIGPAGNGLKLAAAMAVQTLSPDQLMEKTKLSFAEIASFYNSASVSGLLEIVARHQPVVVPPPAPVATAVPNRTSMFARLRSKLGLS